MSSQTIYPSLCGKVIAISGAASGMGLVTAKLLYPMGAKLSLADINKAALEEAANALRASNSSGTDDILTTVVDVSSSSQVDNWIQATVAKFGALNGAANYAGIFIKSSKIVDTTDEEWAKIQSVNQDGTFYAVRAQLRVMSKQGTGGSIVNTASLAGLAGRFACAPYTASKHGVVGITRVAANEVGHLGIRVSAISPGAINTPMFTTAATPEILTEVEHGIPLKRTGGPEEVARLAIYLLSDDSSYSTGGVHAVDGGVLS